VPGEDEILVVSPSAAAGAVLLLLGLAAAARAWATARVAYVGIATCEWRMTVPFYR